MVRWTVRVFLLIVAFAKVFCESTEVQLVKNLIIASNNHFRDQNRTEIPIPDTSWFLGAIQFQNGRLGRFDSVELQPDPEIVSRTNTNGTIYVYNFRAALRNLTINYQFHVNIPLFEKYGNVIITVGKKSFQVEGRVLVKHDGTCFAMLQDAQVVQLDDFQVRFEPDNTPFITKIYQAVLNVIHNQIIPIINRTIRAEISRQYFKEKFNEMTCAELVMNSTTEAPTNMKKI